jgi:hypothetical protein
MYALAASAAGVGILALVQPAEAKIVYTPAHVKIGINSNIPLDLNHDGVSDFAFGDKTAYSGHYHWGVVAIVPASGGGKVWGTPPHSSLQWASALHSGVKIHKDVNFRPGRHQMVYGSWFYPNSGCDGPWTEVKNRYLALEFSIKGKVHFGWARLSVSCSKHIVGITGTLTGYAYETVVGKSLRTGQEKEDTVESASRNQTDTGLNERTPRSATLGLLAVGTPGLSIWRREEPAGIVR